MSRYYRVSPRFWVKARERGWSEDTTILALYLLTCEHRTTEGLFRLPKPYMQSDLEWLPERFTKPFAELLRDGFIEYDDQAQVIFICKALKYQRPENPNQIKAAIKSVEDLPSTPLLERLVTVSERLAKPFAKALREHFGKPIAQSPSPSPSHCSNAEAAEATAPAGATETDPPPEPVKPEGWSELLCHFNSVLPKSANNPDALRELLEWVELMGCDIIRRAVNEASDHGVATWAYARSCLVNWQEAGAYTLPAVEALIAERKRKRGRGARDSPEGGSDHGTTGKYDAWS